MFFKCAPNARNLEPLFKVVMSSPRLLKQRVGTSRTYIRPFQKDLDMSLIFHLPEGVRYDVQCPNHESYNADPEWDCVMLTLCQLFYSQ